jgi:FRG domain
MSLSYYLITHKERSMFDVKDITLGHFGTVAALIDFANQKPITVGQKTWAFRGQPKTFGTLVPSFQRQFTIQSYGTAEIIERRLINDFRAHYENLKERSNDMPQPSRIGANYDLRCLSVMQHYEIPTRLLDWSSNFWTSLYFACASEPGENAEMWFYHRSIFDKQQIENNQLFSLLDINEYPAPEPHLLYKNNKNFVFELDPRINPRMKEQQGHHTVSTDVFADHAPLLYELIQEQDIKEYNMQAVYGRFTIEAACKSKAIQFLAEEMNITASTIFPDVVGLGRFLRWQFESLRTMMM